MPWGYGFAHGLHRSDADSSLDLTSSNVLFELKNLNSWSESEVYQFLGEPKTARVRLRSGAVPGPYTLIRLVEPVQHSNIDAEWLTGNICIIDFGLSFYTEHPPDGMLGTPAAYFAPEMQFTYSASVSSDVWALGCLIFELQASRLLFPTFNHICYDPRYHDGISRC